MNPDDWQGLIPEMGLRPVQFDALARIWAAYEDGAEVVLLEAPTGVGKSIIQLKKELARKQKASRGSRREPGTRDMIPAQIVRALGTAARLTGQDWDRKAPRGVTHSEYLRSPMPRASPSSSGRR